MALGHRWLLSGRFTRKSPQLVYSSDHVGKEVSIAADGKVDGVEVTWTGEAPGAGKLVITEVAGTGKVKIGEIEFTNPGKTSGDEGVFDHEVVAALVDFLGSTA